MVAINSAKSENKVRFRWNYVAVPVVLLLLSIILAACFYPFLSSAVAYHFQGDSPDRWLSRGGFVAWMIIPQLFFTLLAIGVVRMVMLTARFIPADSSPLPRLLPIMGNMLAIPQLIFVFAMLQFFLYDVYQVSSIPVWLLSIIVLVLGAIILAVIFIRTVRRYRRQAKTNQE
ncbi:MAG: hypothetical protein ACYDG5_08080 [Dehalococcoidales bacterium]